MKHHRIDVEEDSVVIKLATGEEIRICWQDYLGIEGYRVKVFASQQIVVLPSSGNAVTLTTPAAMKRLDKRAEQVVAERDKDKGAR